MKFTNNLFFVFSTKGEFIERLTTIIQKKYTEDKGNQVITSSSNKEAKKYLEPHRGKQYYDIVFLDWSIPEEDKKRFIDYIDGVQTSHDWIVISENPVDEDEITEYFKYADRQRVNFISLAREDTLISLISSIAEKRFNENKYNLVNTIDEIVNLRKDSDEILGHIVNLTLRSLNLKLCLITKVNYQDNEIIIGAMTGADRVLNKKRGRVIANKDKFEEQYKKVFNIILDEASATTRSIRHREQVQYPDVLADDCPFKYKEFAKKIGLKSILITPIFEVSQVGKEKQVIATLNLYTDIPHEFRDDEMELARLIAAKTAIVLSMTGLYQDQLDETRRKMELIEKVAAEINRNVGDYENVFKTIVDGGKKLVHAQRGCIKLYDKDTKIIDRVYPEHCSTVPCSAKREKLRAQDVTSHVIQAKKSEMIDDLDTCTFKDPNLNYDNYKSRISVPLLSGEEVIGVLTVEHRDKAYFNESHLQLFEALAKHAVIAIENSARYKLLQKRYQSQEVIKRLSEETSKLEATEDSSKRERYRKVKLDSLIREAVIKTGEVFEASSGFVVLADFKEKTTRRDSPWQFGLADFGPPEMTIGVLEEDVVVFPGNAESSITGKVIADGIPYNCQNVKGDPYFLNYCGNTGVRSEIVVPLKFQEQTLGVFALDSKKENAFTKEDQEILESIATQMAMLIKRFRYLNKLMDLNKPFKNLHNLDKLYTEIVKRTVDTLETKVSYFRIIDREELTVKGKIGLENSQDMLPLRINEGIAGKVADTMEYRKIRDVQKEPGYKYKEFAQENKLHAMIAVPVLSRDISGGKELIGVLTSYANRVCNFAPLDVQLMQSIAEKAAVSIMNAKLFQQLDAVAKIDEGFTRKKESRVLREITSRARQILDADQVVLYQYKSSEPENAGFIMPGIIDGAEFIDKNVGLLQNVTPDGILAQLVGMEKNEFWIDSFENNPDVEALYKKRKTKGLPRFYEREDLKSAIILKLTLERDVVGILFVNYRYKKSFSSDEKKIAKTFANKAALAISNTRKYDAVTRLHDVGNAIATESVIDKVLHQIGFNARKTLNADNIILYRKNDSESVPFHEPLRIGEIYSPEKISGKYVRDSVLAKIIDKGESVFAPDVNEHPVFKKGDDKEEPGFVAREKIKSCAALILRVRKRFVGVIFINYRVKQQFKPFQKNLVKIFANQVAIAIRNAGLIEHSRDNVERIKTNLEAIQESGNKIVNSFKKRRIEREDILQPILDEAMKLTHLNMGYISLVDEKNETAVIRVCSTQFKTLIRKAFKHPYKESDWVREHKRFDIFSANRRGHGKGFNFTRFSDLPHLFADYNGMHFNGDAGVMSALRVPIYSAEKTLLGMIVLESTGHDVFSEEDALAVVSLANQASLALQNYRLIVQQKQLRNVGFELLTVQDSLEKILDTILKTVIKLVKKKYADIKLLVENDPTKLKIDCAWPRRRKRKPLDVKDCLCAEAIERKSKVYKKDLSKQPHLIKKADVDEGTKSVLILPLIAEDRIIGVLDMQSVEIDDFLQENIQPLEILATQAANAISLYRQKRELAEKQKEADIGHVTRESVHWVGNKIGPIRNASERLQKKVDEWQATPSGDNMKYYDCYDELCLIHKSALSALAIKSDLIDEGKKREDVDLISVLKDSIRVVKNENEGECKYVISDSGINVDRFVIRYDKTHIERLFHYVLKNALQAIEDIKKLKEELLNVPFEGRLVVSVFETDTHFVVEITDNGCGIPDEDIDQLFRPFFTTKGADRGSGVGLYFCKRTMDALNGRIYIKETKYAEGTTFSIEFPLNKNE